MINLILLILFPVAGVLAAAALSDGLMQWLATTLRGTPLEPRQLLTVRKVCYVALVVYLFTGAYQWRASVVNTSAAQFAVREQSHGDVHLSGSIVRLGLGGFRGVTTCYLWNLAMDKQMKNQLNELEVIVGWLTELQPHFNTPWLFQSWNLAYNVSNKTDQPSDKYFWISRGCQLLADGERQNHDDPDLRFEMGTTFQHKICQSDETNYHRSLFQLSLIPPNERDPARFRPRPGRREKVDLEEFAKFCDKHPQLIRRLREGIHKDSLYEQNRLFTCRTPEDVVKFLGDNFRVPSLWPEGKPTPAGVEWAENPDRALDPDVTARFPVLPPPRSYPQGSPMHLFRPYDDMDRGDLTDESPKEQDLDSWDAYLVARAWYSYAQEPIPDPADLPGETQPIVDRIHQRMNRRMQTILFRHYPARAQSYVAERLEEEGWYDNEGWSTRGPEWFTRVIGGGRDWAVNAWGEAYKMWKAHGERNHILMSQAEHEELKAKAQKYMDSKGLTPRMGVPPREENPDLQEGWRAAMFLFYYEAVSSVSNYNHNYVRAKVEKEPQTVRARKLFYQAEALALTGSTVESLQTYQDPAKDTGNVLGGLNALDAWAKILEKEDDFRRDDLIEEQTYETELTYMDVLNRALPGNEMKAQLGAAAVAGAAAGGWLSGPGLLELLRPESVPALKVSKGPFDKVNASDGSPWIPTYIVNRVQERRRLGQPRRKDVDEAVAPPQKPLPQPGAGPPPAGSSGRPAPASPAPPGRQ